LHLEITTNYKGEMASGKSLSYAKKLIVF